MSAKHAINDKLQGSVATYLRCGGVVNDQIKEGLLLSLRVKKKLKSVNIWQSYKQERGCLMHFARMANTLLKTKKVHKTGELWRRAVDRGHGGATTRRPSPATRP